MSKHLGNFKSELQKKASEENFLLGDLHRLRSNLGSIKFHYQFSKDRAESLLVAINSEIEHIRDIQKERKESRKALKVHKRNLKAAANLYNETMRTP